MKLIKRLEDNNSRQFAISIGIDPSQFSKILRGVAAISLEKLVEISSKYAVNLSWLVQGSGTMFIEGGMRDVTDDKGKDLSKENHDNETFLPLYIDSLKEQKRILEVQNDFLRRNFETSLNSIAEIQHVSNNQLKALSWYQALVASRGDEKKADQELAKINNRAAWYGGANAKASIAHETGKKSNARK